MTTEEKISKLEERIQRLELLAKKAMYVPTDEAFAKWIEQAAERSCRILSHDCAGEDKF